MKNKLTIKQAVGELKAMKEHIEWHESKKRNCKDCKHSDNGECAFTEECHECMWLNKYEEEL